MSLHSKISLHGKMDDPKFRQAFVSSRILQTLAMQIRVMRQREDLSQKDLARELGTSQNAIYRLENPKSGRPNVSTLEKVASFFDVGLVVRFVPFSELSDWTLNLSEQSINVPRFKDDLGFLERKGPQCETAEVGPVAAWNGVGQTRGTLRFGSPKTADPLLPSHGTGTSSVVRRIPGNQGFTADCAAGR